MSASSLLRNITTHDLRDTGQWIPHISQYWSLYGVQVPKGTRVQILPKLISQSFSFFITSCFFIAWVNSERKINWGEESVWSGVTGYTTCEACPMLEKASWVERLHLFIHTWSSLLCKPAATSSLSNSKQICCQVSMGLFRLPTSVFNLN